MKAVMLSEMDRALLKVCANNSAGEKEDLVLFIGVSAKLNLSGVPDGPVVACDKDKTEKYELENAEFTFMKKLFDGQRKWPYGWAQDVCNLGQRIDMAVTLKVEKKGKSDKGNLDDEE
jgi:hypothetical protein